MRYKTVLLLTGLLIVFSVGLTGCDTTADRELRRAEKALDAADAADAEASATEDYLAAEEFFNEAVRLAEENRIQEARQAAINAKLRAEDALKKAEERQHILDAEAERLGR